MNSVSQAGTQGANFEAEVEVRDALPDTKTKTLHEASKVKLKPS